MTTQAERRHLDAVASLGCIVCRHMGLYSPALIHHVRTVNGKRITRNHAYVLPLCPRHHAAYYPTGFHAGSRTWQEQHGTEESLMEEVAGLLEIAS